MSARHAWLHVAQWPGFDAVPLLRAAMPGAEVIDVSWFKGHWEDLERLGRLVDASCRAKVTVTVADLDPGQLCWDVIDACSVRRRYPEKPNALILVDGEVRWKDEAFGPWDPGRTDDADQGFNACRMRNKMNRYADRIKNHMTIEEDWLDESQHH